MSGFTEWVYLVLTVTLFLFGMLGNGFIGLVNGSSWLKSRRISLSDIITTLLALCSIILLWTLLVDVCLMQFPFKTHDEVRMNHILGILWAFMHHLVLWLLACLSILYCLRIASFSHPAFLWLKWRVSRVVVWMLLGALLLSCARAMFLIHELKIYTVFFGIYEKGNTTENSNKGSQYKLTHILGTLWDLPPLMASLVSYFLLLHSLRKHSRQIQQYGSSPRDPSTEAHERAIKIIFSFFFLFLFFLLALIFASSRHYLPGAERIKMIGVAVVMFHCVGHSFILIFGNSKLKQLFVQMMRCQPAI
ncbi:taste receptor type 2 member 3-like [Erinaceus europaeus]|uniref:Taste receptor type 2 n=1 Tax=Erinaceus europaeus TaxID=9365 RepID=A0A1S3AAX8_ERIEU|nr:taste receptor type 2 member 3-like [Erinaceus europaeus]